MKSLKCSYVGSTFRVNEFDSIEDTPIDFSGFFYFAFPNLVSKNVDNIKGLEQSMRQSAAHEFTSGVGLKWQTLRGKVFMISGGNIDACPNLRISRLRPTDFSSVVRLPTDEQETRCKRIRNRDKQLSEYAGLILSADLDLIENLNIAVDLETEKELTIN